MSPRLTRFSIPLLRWTLAVVVVLESAQFIFSAFAAHLMAKLGLPQWVRPALGMSEMVAAILFVMPATEILGGYLLLAVFGLAALVHLFHGQFGIESLLVYGAAVLACVAHADTQKAETPHE